MLRSRTDITIKPADKGSATVVMSRQDFLAKVMNHLEKKNFNRKLDEDPMERYAEEVTSFLQNMTDKQTINKEIFNYLRPQKPQTSRFYILPKIRKDGIPRRSTVLSCGAPTEKISQFVDFYLKPLVVKTPSYIKDTTEFLLKLKSISKIASGSLLLTCTLDVCSLYTDIPHEEGRETCRGLLDTRDVLEPHTDEIIKLITLILNKNNFSFNNKHYLQLKGKAMGTCMAPSYANAFMDNLKR